MVLRIAAIAFLLWSGCALASPNCTSEPKSKWLDDAAFRAKIATFGYQFKSVKTTGSCYEIYGRNKEGKRTEVYFNPMTGEIVEEHTN